MVTSRQLHESLILEEIKQNYFLNALNEALNTGDLHVAVQALDKIENLASDVLPTVNSLQIASEKARKDALKLLKIKDRVEASEITAKLVTFYSKIWSFLTRDLPSLTKLLARNFLKSSTPGNTPLFTVSNLSEFRETVIEALTDDESPWYKKIIAYLSGSAEYVSSVPYLNINLFVDEFLKMTKDEFVTALNTVTSQANSTIRPLAFTNVLTTPPVVAGILSSAPKINPPSTPTNADPVNQLIFALNDGILLLSQKFSINDPDKLKEYILDRVFNKKKSLVEMEAEITRNSGTLPSVP